MFWIRGNLDSTWFSDVIENVNSFVGNKVPISICNIHELSYWPVSLNRQKKGRLTYQPSSPLPILRLINHPF